MGVTASRFSSPLCFVSSLFLHLAFLMAAGRTVSGPPARRVPREGVVEPPPLDVVLIDPVGNPPRDSPKRRPRGTLNPVGVTGNAFKASSMGIKVATRLSRTTAAPPPANRVIEDAAIRQRGEGNEPHSQSPARSLPRLDPTPGESKWVDGVGACLGGTDPRCSQSALTEKDLLAVIDEGEMDYLRHVRSAVMMENHRDSKFGFGGPVAGSQLLWNLPEAKSVNEGPLQIRIPPLCLGPICIGGFHWSPVPSKPSHLVDYSTLGNEEVFRGKPFR